MSLSFFSYLCTVFDTNLHSEIVHWHIMGYCVIHNRALKAMRKSKQ